MSKGSLKTMQLCLALCGVAVILGCPRSKEYQAKCLVRAVIRDDLSELKRYESAGYDLNAQDPGHFGWTPLIASIYFEFTNISSYLIGKTNVDVCVRDGTGTTALMEAITCGDTNTGRLLVDKRRAEITKCEDWNMIRSAVAVEEEEEQRAAWIVILNGLIEP